MNTSSPSPGVQGSVPRTWPGKLKIGVVMFLTAAGILLFLSRAPSPSPINVPKVVPRAELILRDGLWQHTNDLSPFNGVMIENHPNGALQSRSAIKGGVLNGLSEGWHTNGQLQVRENFQRGISHGIRTKWYDSGKIMSESHIEKGEHHGLYQRWYENGQFAEEVTFVHGKPNGLSQSYHPSGKLKARVVLKLGEIVEQQFWPEGETDSGAAR